MLSDYSVRYYVEDSVLCHEFDIDYPIGEWWQFADNVANIVEDSDGRDMVYTVSAGSTVNDMDFYFYYMGADLGSSGMNYNFLSLSGYSKYNTISFGASFDFSMTCFTPPAGTIAVKWQCRVKCYDESFNYLDVLTLEKSYTLAGGSTTGNTFNEVFDFELIDDVAYIVPYMWLSVDPSATTFETDMSVRASCLSNLFITVRSDADSSDDLISGTPEQNEAADNANDTLTGSREELEDLADQMDQLVKPDPSDLSSGLQSYVDTESTSAFTEVLHNISNSGIVVTMMCIACTIVLSSYVLFGKRV